MKLPFTTTTPSLEEILGRVPLDEKHLNQLALHENGEQEAANHGRQVFETQFGDEIQEAIKASDAKASDLSRLEEDLNAAKEHRETLGKKLSISPEEAAKHPMSSTTIAVQIFLAGMVVFLLGLGAHNFAMLLIKTGEPFLTRPWMAYVTAFTAATLIAVVLECFINLPKRDETKRLMASFSLGLGIVCGIAYLAVLSQVVPPDFGEPVIGNIIPPLAACRT